MGQNPNIFRHRLIAVALIFLALFALVGCRATPTPTPAPTSGPQEPLPEKNATAVIQPDAGGVVRLRDGAEVAIPRESVSAVAIATLAVEDAPPAAPAPRSLIGQAYNFSLEGGSLTGVALLTLPLPPDVTADQYELAAYRWNGQSWERIGGRLAENGIRLGVNAPALFAVLGQWRLADATLVLKAPTSEQSASTAASSLEVTGEYRFSAPPATQNGLVQARLLLKRDSSGGVGQINGDETLDQTVDEAVLWFKPDPGQAQGVIEFTHTFTLKPDSLTVPLGSANYFYAVLTVADSFAPTRRFSPAVQHTPLLPIRVIGNEVVRPELAATQPESLRWHVQLNGQTLLTLPATEPTLPLADVLAQGGLGDYKIALEAKVGDQFRPVSNEVSVQLILPVTATPTPGQSPLPGATEVAAVETPGTPTVIGTMPATPTRRTPPGERTPTPTAGPSPTATGVGPSPTPTSTRPSWASVFWADRYTINVGECATLYWNVEDVTAVYLDGSPTTGHESRQVCPTQTTTYTLRVVNQTGSQERRVTITVQATAQTTIEFTADRYQITEGQCATLRWRATNVIAVYLDDQGVAGEATREVCPATTTTYKLRVESSSGTTTKELTIAVVPAQTIVIKFWAEQYTMPAGSCTTLHWSVENVQAVYLDVTGQEEGVAGSGTREVCPEGIQFYIVRAVAGDGTSAQKEVTLQGSAPPMSANEVIAQAIVNNVTYVDDLDPYGAGNLQGWRLLLDGVNPLFKGSGDCCETTITLQITQAQASGAYGSFIDWPINIGQLIEFRAFCTAGVCNLDTNRSFYLKLRSD